MLLLSDALNMPANLEYLAVATGLEKVFSFQFQRKAMPKNVQTNAKKCSNNAKNVQMCSNYTHFTH